MSVQSFIFGGDTGLSYEQLQKRRAVLEAMQERAMGSAPRNVGEGLNAVGQALAYRIQASKLGAAEADAAKTQAGFDATLNNAYGAAFDAAPVTSGAGAGFGGSTGAIADASTPAASLPQSETASYVRDGLLKRGLPSHVADAFVANFQDESGLNPGINEQNPTVAGSRGGYGLYQLTGPRRRAYEAYAQAQGIDPSNIDGQLDFMMSELQGPEAGAAKSILSAPDTATAAQAIVKNFLRPAPEHLRSRSARYAGLSDQQPVQVASLDAGFMPQAPAEPQTQMAGVFIGTPEQYEASKRPQAAPALPPPQTVAANPVPPQPDTSFDGFSHNGGVSTVAAALQGQLPAVPQAPSGPVAQVTDAVTSAARSQGVDPRALIGIVSNPQASPQQRQVAQALLEQQMGRQQAAQKQAYETQQLQEKRAYDRMTLTEQRAYDAQLKGVEFGREDARFAVTDRNADRDFAFKVEQGNKPTDDVREFEYARGQGYEGSFLDFQLAQKKAAAASTNVTVGGDSGEFFKEADKNRGKAVAEAAQAGDAAQRSLIQIGELEKRLAAVGTGGMASVRQMAANLGIPIEGADDIQAATAIINQLVPGQRPPGSGTMSDADVELFKQSLPRIINTEGGNQKILATMRGIAQYDAQRGSIANQILNREITPAEGQRLMNAIPNPLAGMRGDVPEASAAPSGDGWQTLPNGVKIRVKP